VNGGEIAVGVLLGFVPVLLFLVALIVLDSYKLVRLRWVLASIVAGGWVAVVCFVVAQALIPALGLEPQNYSRWLAPPIEEFAKAALVVYLIRSHRVGFLVDAAIYGFAIGAGFAVLESAYYWIALDRFGPGVWLVRGFGTALVHGGATALFAIAAKARADRRRSQGIRTLAPALVPPVALHWAFNQFVLTPVMSTVVVLVALPPLMYGVFRRGERTLEDWLELGFDTDSEMLSLIESGRLSDAPAGEYLGQLRDRFEPEVVVDMLCFLRLHLELSLRAKGILMMREAGVPVEPDPTVRASLDELAFLERSIGATGKLAMAPLIHTNPRRMWELQVLQGARE